MLRPSNDNRDDWERIARLVAGECSEEDAAVLRGRAAVDEAARRRLEEARFVWEVTQRPADGIDVGAAWEEVDRRVRDGQESRLTRLAVTPAMRPERGPRPRARSTVSPLLRYAAVLAVVAGVLLVLRHGTDLLSFSEIGQAGEAEYAVATERGQRMTLRLSDGTRVILNAESRLALPSASDPRAVHLEGEAFFEVAHDPRRPFVIQTDGARVRVLGTTFSVSAYGDRDEVRVAVAEGSVSLHADGAAAQDTVVLRRRDLGIASSRGLTVREHINLDRYHAWVEGRLVFDATRLDEVARDLERKYDVQIQFADSTLQRRLLTATFDNHALPNVLKIIAYTLGIHYEHHDHQVTFFE